MGTATDQLASRSMGSTFLLCLAAIEALAQPPPAVQASGTPRPPAPPAASASRLTGDWGGLRSALEDRGLEFNLYLNTTYGHNLLGGRDVNEACRGSGSYDLLLHADFQKMDVIPGGELLLFVQGYHGRNVNDVVRAIGEPFDDADGDESAYIDQLWYQQSLWGRKVQLRLGYLDQQAIIDRNAYANSEDKQFMNTLLDNQNVIVPLTIGQGAVLFLQPLDWLGFSIGVADGEGRAMRDGFDTAWHGTAHFFTYFQTDVKLALLGPRGPLTGTYRFGVLYDPRTKLIYSTSPDDVPDDYDSDDFGFYLNVDQMLYRERSEDDQGLGVFARCGVRDGEVNQIELFWSAGLQYKGLAPGRGQDVLGAGVYSLHAGSDYQRYVNSDFTRETGFELYYKIQVAPWLDMTPDLQYIVQPGGLRGAHDDLVAGVRARVSF